MTVSEMIQARQLPALLDREKMVDLLLEDEYGRIPEIPYEISVSEPELVESRYCNDTVQHSTVNFTVTTQYGSHTIPVQRILHVDGSVNPFFVFLNFRPQVPDRSYPTEEIGENGFDVLNIHYTDIASDDDDFTNGLAGIFLPDGKRKNNDCSKVALWAWFACRVLDYAQTLPSLDKGQAAVLGASRLGKTALVAGMTDTRFRYVFSSVSGCSGAALARGNSGNAAQENYKMETIFEGDRDMTKGETIRFIVKSFPYFSCRNYHKYITTNIPDDYDQHFLMATIAPRFVYIASASKDYWADPTSEFLGGVAASPAYEKLGYKGLIHNEKLPEPGEHFHEGRIGYHLREGSHFLSRRDWLEFMTYIRKHQNDKL